MASDYWSYKQVLAELHLTAEQLDEIVKAGKLRTFLDAGEKKFRTSDIAAFKRAAESQEALTQDATVSSESKLDLSEIESEPGADIADQTSVLDLEGGEATPARPEEPVMRIGTARLNQKIAIAVMWLLAALTLGVLVFIIAFVLANGLPHVSWTFLSDRPRSMGREGGVFPMIVATVYVTGLAVLIAGPIGVATAIYLT